VPPLLRERQQLIDNVIESDVDHVNRLLASLVNVDHG